jgi:hypothetical protein
MDDSKENNQIGLNDEIAKRKVLREHSLIEPIIRNPFVNKIKFRWVDKIKVQF